MQGRRKSSTLGQVLIKNRKITAEQLKEALQIQKTRYEGRMLGEVLVKEGYINEDDLYAALSAQFMYPSVEVGHYTVDRDLLSLVPRDMAARHLMLPLDRFGNVMTLAMVNPLDKDGIEAVESSSGLKVRAFIISRKDFDDSIGVIYGKG